MKALTLARSFAGGEITPELVGRVDLSKFQTGVALCKNMLPLPHGVLARRPGTKHLGFTNFTGATDKVRLFAYHDRRTGNDFCLEFGNLHCSVWDLNNPQRVSNGLVVAVNGRFVTVSSHTLTAGQQITIGPLRFRVRGIVGNVLELEDRLGGNAVVPAGVEGFNVLFPITFATPYATADLPTLRVSQSGDTMVIAAMNFAPRTLVFVPNTVWILSTVNFTQPAPPSAPTVVATVAAAGSQTPATYAVTYTNGLGTESAAALSPTVNNNLNATGNFNTISWPAAVGAVEYLVYKRRGGTFGFMGRTTSTSVVDDNILPDTTITPPSNRFNVGTPSAVAHHEQRLWYGGSDAAPQGIVASAISNPADFASAQPTQPDDAFSITASTSRANPVRHLLSFRDLIAFTGNGQFRIESGNGGIAPDTLRILPQGSVGCSDSVPPSAAENSVLFVQNGGGKLRELTFSQEGGGYVSSDLTVMAPHLFENRSIIDMAFVRTPHPTVWMAMSSGDLVSCTYLPEQQVVAFAQHDVGGRVDALCSVRQLSEDFLYLHVFRGDPGAEEGRIERMSPRALVPGNPAGQVVYMDSHVDRRSGTTVVPFVTGTTVAQIARDPFAPATAPYAVLPSTAASLNSVVSLDEDGSGFAGLNFVSDVQTLPLSLESPSAGQGVTKNVSAVRLRVRNTATFKAGPSFTKLVQTADRATPDLWDSAPAARTEEVRVSVPPTWGPDGSVCLRQDLPLNLTVVSMVLETQVGS